MGIEITSPPFFEKYKNKKIHNFKRFTNRLFWAKNCALQQTIFLVTIWNGPRGARQCMAGLKPHAFSKKDLEFNFKDLL